MDMKYPNLESLLISNKCPKGKRHTHTRIPDKTKKLKIYGGSYLIPDDLTKEFWHHYHKKVFIDKKKEYLTERQLKGDSVLAIDFDFRYNTTVTKRQHTEEHITDVVGEVCELLDKYLEMKNGDQFKVYVFHKSGVNKLEEVTKDGIHIIFQVNIPVSFKCLLWDELVSRMEDCWGGDNGLPIINTWESVLDKGVMRGETNWQVFGSQKPHHEAYQLDTIYTLEKEDQDFTINTSSTNNTNYYELLPNISIRNKDNVRFEIKEHTKSLLEKYTKKKKTKKTIKIKNYKKTNLNNISSKEQLLEECDKIINQKHKEEYKFKDVHDYTMILTSEYYNDYDNWLKVGFALKNTDNDLFMTWMMFSEQSEKFSFEEIGNFKDMWDNFENNGELTEGTIRFYAKESNTEEYNKIKNSSVQNYIQKSLGDYNDCDIAQVLFQLYHDDWKCVSIRNFEWFQFYNNRWQKSEKGTGLRLEISKTVSRIYLKLQQEILEKFHNDDDMDSQQQMQWQKMAHKYAEIALNLRKTEKKNNAIKEAGELMYDKEFLNKLDSNGDLIGFINGVVDVEKCKFRKGYGIDYISMCTNIAYVEIDEDNPEHTKIVAEINDFMEKLFPVEELKNYMWEHLASIMMGNNVNQTFNFYLGCGSNGKSLFIELLEMCMGDYKGHAPLNMITGNRTKEGQATPEIIGLKGKRLAVLQEAKKKTVINEGPFKEYTGCDSITGRGLYRSEMITYKPQFSMVLMTNHLPEIKSNDNGTWRRIRVVNFMSTFVDNPDDPELANESFIFKRNHKLKERFEDWAPIFMSMIVKIIYRTKGVVKDVPIVLQASKQYREKQDYFTQFCNEYIVKSTNCWLQKMDVKEEFKQWYLENFGNDIPKNKELFEFFEKKYGRYNKKKGWKNIKMVMNKNSDSDSDDD